MAPELTPQSQEYGGYHHAAAVLSTFEEATLKPAKPAPHDSLDDLLFDSIPTSSGEGRSRWVMAPDVRQHVLRDLGSRAALKQALNANPNRPDDPVQHMLEAYIDGRATHLENQSRVEVASTFQVVQWLDGVIDDLPKLEDVKRRQELLSLLQPFEELAGSHFRGREGDLAKLRAYVDVLPPGSFHEGLRRIAARVSKFQDKPLLVIRGPGGVGKSALVSRFIWEHTTLPATERFPWIYLDFDRPGLQIEEPLTLLLEGVRQLGIQYPEASTFTDRIYTLWREQLSKRRGLTRSLATAINSQVVINAASGEQEWDRYLKDFASLLGNLKVENAPLLLVLDTFEEVQNRSTVVLSGLGRFLSRLLQHVPRLRAVLAGRAPMDVLGLPMNVVELNEFDASSAQAFLEAHGVNPPEIARALVEQVGRNPLSLKLALDVWRQEGAGPGGIQDLRTRNLFFARVQDSQIQGQLFTRIIEHIKMPDLAKLASPGLVLRRITAPLIREVLAEPCGVSVPDDERAEFLFNGLRADNSLVRVDDVSATDRGVRQPSEIRHLVLPLLRAAQPDVSRRIEQAAVAYYERRSGPVARAEELYHRLSLQQSLVEIESRWSSWPTTDWSSARSYMFSALDEHELAAPERAWLKTRLGESLTDDERAQSDLGAWERDTARRVTEYLERGFAEDALTALRERSVRTEASPLYVLEAQVLERLGQWDAARDTVERGLTSISGAADRRLEIELSVYRARLNARAGEIDTAMAGLMSADALATGRGGDPLARIEIGLLLLALRPASSQPDVAADTAQRAELMSQFRALSDAQITEDPPVSGWLAAELGSSQPEVLVRVVRLTGLPALAQTALRALGAALAVWDSDVTAQTGEARGVLARLAGIPVLDTLTETWTSFALQASPTDFLTRLLLVLDSGHTIAPVVISTLTDILRDRAAGLLPVLPPSSITAPPPSPSQVVGEVPLRISPGHVTLRREQLQQLTDVLVNAFPNRTALSDMVRFRLERSLDSLALTDNLRETIFQLVRAADIEDWLPELIGAARESRPNDAGLVTFAAQFGLAPRAASGDIDLNSLALHWHGAEDPGEWVATLGQLEAQVCRVIVQRPSGPLFGTGFLVGPDVLLTAFFIVSDVVAGQVSPWDVRLEFDVKHLADGVTVSPGTQFALESDWLIDANEELNYALLRVAGAPGTRPIGGERAEPSATWRGWIDLPEEDVDASTLSSVLILEHGENGPVKIARGDRWHGLNASGDRVRYEVPTTAGSAGAPVFTAGWRIVALHHSARDGAAEGTPIAAILRLLDKRGKRYTVGAAPA